MPADVAAAVIVAPPASVASSASSRGVVFSLLGCHVSIARGAYSHHGIVSAVTVDARGMQRPDRVIHYVKSDDGCSEGRIDETEFAAFLAAQSSADLSYHVYDAHSCPFTVDEVVARARHCIGLSDYSLWNSNCEHFATWCHTDRPQSKQVDSAVRGVVATVVAAAGVMLFKLYSNRRQKHARDEAQQPQSA